MHYGTARWCTSPAHIRNQSPHQSATQAVKCTCLETGRHPAPHASHSEELQTAEIGNLNLAHMSCLTCLNRVSCACMCVSEWVFAFDGSGGVVEVMVALDFPSAPACPRGGPCVHGKGTALFQTVFSGSDRATLRAATPDRHGGTRGPKTAGAVTSLAQRNAVLLSETHFDLWRNRQCFKKRPRLDSGNY